MDSEAFVAPRRLVRRAGWPGLRPSLCKIGARWHDDGVKVPALFVLVERIAFGDPRYVCFGVFLTAPEADDRALGQPLLSPFHLGIDCPADSRRGHPVNA